MGQNTASRVLIIVGLLTLGSRGLAEEPRSKYAVFDIPGHESGATLHLEHAAPTRAGCTTKRVALLVHGGFFPSSTVFAADLPGGSALDRLAAACVSTYALDVRGFGGSTRPAFMNEPVGPYVAYATTTQAQQDVGSALAFIRKREHVQRVSLVGWSWGSAITGGYASKQPEQVDKLVLYGPAWIAKAPPPAQPLPGSYRTLDRAASRARVLNGVPPERAEEINPSAWFERWWALNLRYDTQGSQRNPPIVRAPSGGQQDFTDFWSQGKSPWDPSQVRAPTLVIVGEWDQNTPVDNAKTVHGLLTHAASRELKILPEATHFAILEKNRAALLDEFVRFLGAREAAPLSAKR
ncbi:MAG: alpha/beta hydrolase [Polyangiales bacterium]